MKKRRLIWISILLLVVISAAWFGRDTQVPGLQLAPINWAVTGDFDNDPAAQAMLRGLEIFIANTNQSGGYQGHPIQLLRFNQAPQAQAKPDDDIIATINNSDALAVIGQHGDIKAAARAYHLYKIPFIAPLSTAPGLTEFNEWTFRLNYDDVQQSTALVQYVKRILQRNKLILLSNKRDRLHGALSQAAQNAGLQFELIAPDDMLVKLDSASAISAIKGETANSALVLALPAKPAKEITRRLRDQHLDAEIIAVNALASPSFLNSFSDLAAEQRQRGFYTDGLHFPQPLVADNMPTAAREILDAAGHDGAGISWDFCLRPATTAG